MSYLGNIMVDIETMGNSSNSVILSIGAVEFNMETGETGREFCKKIDFQSCLDIGLTVDASTVMFWMEQKYEARKPLFESKGEHICNVLLQFSDFVNKCGGKEVKMWGNSASFDLGLLTDAYSKGRMESIESQRYIFELPWAFWNERCVRTLSDMRPEVKKNMKFDGVAHTEIDDCKHQIKYCHETYKLLNT